MEVHTAVCRPRPHGIYVVAFSYKGTFGYGSEIEVLDLVFDRILGRCWAFVSLTYTHVAVLRHLVEYSLHVVGIWFDVPADCLHIETTNSVTDADSMAACSIHVQCAAGSFRKGVLFSDLHSHFSLSL
jgi:hypothetical protein